MDDNVEIDLSDSDDEIEIINNTDDIRNKAIRVYSQLQQYVIDNSVPILNKERGLTNFLEFLELADA